MNKQRTPLGVWWDAARTYTRDALKVKLGPKRSSWIHQLASGHRKASVETAGAIVDAVNAVEGREVLTRADLIPACAACPHFKACRPGVTIEVHTLVSPKPLAAPGAMPRQWSHDEPGRRIGSQVVVLLAGLAHVARGGATHAKAEG